MEKTVKIKGMVCRRCIAVVKGIVESQRLAVHQINLGEVTYQETDATTLKEVNRLLVAEGFEILTDKQTQIINKVKQLVEEHLMHHESHTKNFANVVADTLYMDYDAVSSLFSTTEGIKLEQYIIQKRIDKVRELLKYSQLSLTDIAFELNYSSVHHLSNQFKKITGMSPSIYREIKAESGKSFNEITLH